MSEMMDAHDAAKAEEARVQAEARRKRILEKANKRLGVVSGEQALPEEEKKVSASNAARIRAARQRRYGKKSATPSKEEPQEAEEGGGEEIKTEEDKDVTDDPPAGDTSTVEEPAAKPDPPVVPASESATSIAPEEPATDSSSGKKKYMGVAKMRRKMIAKKKQEEGDMETDCASPATATTSSPAVAKVMKTQKVAKVPIYMHIVIVLLLFLAGLDVGIQQFHDDVVVHTETAISEYGLPFVQRKPWEPVVAKHHDAKQALENELLPSHGGGPTGSDPRDEFGELSGEEEYEPKIDPLFGVDLDEMTKGPGIFNQMARGAIAIHRMILWLLYYTPMNIFNTLLSIPVALMKMPPALFLIALVLRQIVGKIVLGAHIPDAHADSPEEKNNIEVISMAKNFVKNFFATNFPTLAWAYDVFVHLRADMYIVLCGVFCGMAWSHLTIPPLAVDGSWKDAAPIDGMADEL
jgi:hypothetical protein